MATRIREKAARRAENKDLRARAVVRYIRMSPYKVRQVVDLVRGKGYTEAVAMLDFIPRSASRVVKKVVMSAGANAEFKGLNKDELFIAKIVVDQGPTLKRMQPRAQGRAFKILKRTSHITVVLDNK